MPSPPARRVHVAGGRLAGRRRPVRPFGVTDRPAAAPPAPKPGLGVAPGGRRAQSHGVVFPQQRADRRAWPGSGEAGWGCGVYLLADCPVGAWGSALLRSSPPNPRGRGRDAP